MTPEPVSGRRRRAQISCGLPEPIDYSIVVPIRNAVFLSIATAWAFSLNASLVAYGAHKGDTNYPDCRPIFSKKIQNAFNQGEIDGIKKKIRSQVSIWSPFQESMTKSDLIKKGYKILGNLIFSTWSCYSNKKYHCGKCESCINRKNAFVQSGIIDETKYL